MTATITTNAFTHKGKLYDLTRVRLLTQSDRAFIVPLKHLLWVLDHDTPSEERIAKSKLRFPLLVTREVVGGKILWTVVDGLHRLEKYKRKGITVIPCKLVSDEVLRKTEIHS